MPGETLSLCTGIMASLLFRCAHWRPKVIRFSVGCDATWSRSRGAEAKTGPSDIFKRFSLFWLFSGHASDLVSKVVDIVRAGPIWNDKYHITVLNINFHVMNKSVPIVPQITHVHLSFSTLSRPLIAGRQPLCVCRHPRHNRRCRQRPYVWNVNAFCFHNWHSE